MSSFNNAVLTDRARKLLAEAQAGNTGIRFTKCVTGDGDHVNDDLTKCTSLKSKKQEFGISTYEIIDESTILLKIIINNIDLDTGYHFKEFAVYAKASAQEDSEEFLYTIATAKSNRYDYVPPYDSLSPQTINVEFYTTIANADSVTIVGVMGTFADAEEVRELKAQVKTLDENKPEIVLMDGFDIPLSERGKNKIYLKVTDKQSAGVSNIKVSPTMGITIVD